MVNTKKQPSRRCHLMDLPDDAMEIIAACLSEPDKESFMGVCKEALKMIWQTDDLTIKVTKHTKFAGLRQILDQEQAEITLHGVYPSFQDIDIQPAFHKPMSALAIFMGMVPDKYLTQVASNCRWECVTIVTVEGTSLRCLVPQFFALACPSLLQLTIKKPSDTEAVEEGVFTSNIQDAQPVAVCMSLKRLVLDVEYADYELPPAYHSPAELRYSLPNLDTLAFPNGANAALIHSFATQLTRLCMYGHISPDSESIRQCSSLQYLSTYALILPDYPADLEVLELGPTPLSDNEISKLVALPRLSTLKCITFTDIQKDWSGHACSWQKLHFEKLPDFTTFSHLNLINLKELVMDKDQSINLPDPVDPDSIAAVQRAADNLAGIDRAVITHQRRTVHFGECGTLTWRVPESDSVHEHTAAKLIRIAAQRIGPAKICNIEDILHRPRVVEAVLDWGERFIESICLGNNYEPPTYTWEALRHLRQLHTLVFWDSDQDEYDTFSQEHAQAMLKISSAVCTASQQYVIPNNRRLRMEFGVIDNTDSSEAKEALTTEAPQYLEAALCEVLPDSCEVVSIELCSMLECTNWTSYGDACSNITYIWVVVIEPSLSSA